MCTRRALRQLDNLEGILLLPATKFNTSLLADSSFAPQ
jgi:hypothetical protein